MTTLKLNKIRKTALAILLASAAVTPVAAQDTGATPVVWINGTNVNVNGNTITETCDGCGNSGAESQQTLTSGDGYVEFVAGTGVFAVGIGSGPFGTKLDNMEYGLYFNGNGSVEVRENGGVYVIDTRYQPGDRFRIALQNGMISYHKYEGSRLAVNHSSENRANVRYPAKVEAVLLGAGSSVSQAVVRAGAVQQDQTQNTSTQPGMAGNLTWTNTSNVTVNGATLTGTGDAQNSGAQSNETLSGDGFVEFTAVEIDKMRAIGLDSQNDTSNTFQDIDFAIVLRESTTGGNAVAEVWENGAYISDTPYAAGDRFRIAVEGGVVKYYKMVNGQPQQIQARDSRVQSFPLHVDAALYGQQATLSDVTGRRLN